MIILLGKPMNEALEMLKVSKNIRSALVEDSGPLAPVLDFVRLYEAGEWQEISRLMLLGNILMDPVQEAYTSSLEWYRDLFQGLEEEEEG